MGAAGRGKPRRIKTGPLTRESEAGNVPHEVRLPWTPPKLVELRTSKEVTNGPEIRSIEGAPPAEQTSGRDTPAELKTVTVNLVCERASKEQQLECELAITTRARDPAATSWVASMPSSRGICTSIGITSLPAWAAERCRRRGHASCGRHRLVSGTRWPGTTVADLRAERAHAAHRSRG
jgi:hypothetical protein